ncbi:MAG: prepilin-type N-terminal cleavage/methylation domain-containing protein [Candidatus Omnitrophica bacterium]|nr:prepilin-type N-terminal cleavage/methylation domain-containing protein [Candidatus Omnitrophota bacterium]
MKNSKSFTLIELMIVLLIVGILAALGVANYSSARENAFDREAQANLSLILAAERIARMESNVNPAVYLAPTIIPTPNAGINQDLNLLLPVNNSAWDYTVRTCNSGVNFCAQAARNLASVRRWCISNNNTVPSPNPCNACTCNP